MSTREPIRRRRVRFEPPAAHRPAPEPPFPSEPAEPDDLVDGRPIPPFHNHDDWDFEEILHWAWAIFEKLASLFMTIFVLFEGLKFCIRVPSFVANTNLWPRNPFVPQTVRQTSTGRIGNFPWSTVQMQREDDSSEQTSYFSTITADTETYDIFSDEIPTIIDDSFALSDDLPPTTKPPMFTFGHGHGHNTVHETSTGEQSRKTYTLVTDEPYMYEYPALTERPLPTPENAWDIPLTSADAGSRWDGPMTEESESSQFTGSRRKTLPITTVGRPWPDQMPRTTIQAFYGIIKSASNLTTVELSTSTYDDTLQLLKKALAESNLSDGGAILSQIGNFQDGTKNIASEVNSYLMLVSMTEDYLHSYLDQKTTSEQKLHAYGAVGFLRYLLELQAKSLLQAVRMAQDDLINAANFLRRSAPGRVNFHYSQKDEDELSDVKFSKFYTRHHVQILPSIWKKVVAGEYDDYDIETLAKLEDIPRKLHWKTAGHLRTLYSIGKTWEDSK